MVTTVISTFVCLQINSIMDKSMENIISIFMVLFLIVAFSLLTVFFAVQVCTYVNVFYI